MNDWLIKYKDKFQDEVFEFLWRQWSTLGVAGITESKDDRVIDPDTLLLFSLSVCRYEPRLFDEIIDWLSQNGHLINVQRLQQVQIKYDFDCGPQLSAIAERLSKTSKYKLKWSGLAKKYHEKPAKPLFFDKKGKALPYPKGRDCDLEFLAHGLMRGKINLRDHSGNFDIQNPACLLLRLRALLGINARAEILCLLASVKEIHPSEAARRTAYYQKTIQTTLVDMAQSGVILTRTSKKEKFYGLKPGTLDTLLKPNGKSSCWINWPALLKTIEIVWEKLCELSNQKLDPLLRSSELKKLMSSTHKYADIEINEILFDQNIPIEQFDDHFRKSLLLLSNKINPI